MNNNELPKNVTYATAESITGGRLQSYFTEKTGSSSYFIGGITAYTTKSKIKLLGVNEDVAKEYNSVCAQVAREMALGCYELFGADVSIATTGYVQEYVFNETEYDPVIYIAVLVKNKKTDSENVSDEAIYQRRVLLPKENSREENLYLANQCAIKFVNDVMKGRIT